MPQRLGQHFLVNRSVISKITDALSIEKGDFLIEVGPGRGELTVPVARRALEAGATFVAIEKDPRLAKIAGEALARVSKSFGVTEADALGAIPSLAAGTGGRAYKIFGNLPYYISGKFFKILGELDHKPVRGVFMLQKEVAERIAAIPPHMNRLAARIQFWAHPTIIASLKEKDFEPPPRVRSSVLLLETLDSALGDKEKYYALVARLFRQPRQTILNNLFRDSKKTKEEIVRALRGAHMLPESRPQELAPHDIVRLSKFFSP